ncbi:MAG: 8-amino-7-oxononanoate synthase [Prevotellaceae bacterium]|jgi:8-amino-7-oxononanoate synthase|nr:8-amino-7-oxononanoate synthase [Prevotellaceae bacterium]
MTPQNKMLDGLRELENKGLLRHLQQIRHDGVYIEHKGKRYLNLSSNDYLGISGNRNFQREFLETLDTNHFVMGALSSRLLTGNHACIEYLENSLAELYGNECLMYNSGYHANAGILPAIVRKGDLIVADKLVHASIIDGIRLCLCETKRYKHNDYSDLERILEQSATKYETIYIVTESIFSMEGDTADIERIVSLKEKYRAKLYIDEAHAFGVTGESGLGCAHHKRLVNRIEYIVCTLGKAGASEGAFVVCDSATKQWLINKSRTLIFTTATPPINILWSHFVIGKIVEMKKEREHLRRITKQLRDNLAEYDIRGDTHIVPIIAGENDKCISLAEKMLSRGIWVMPVRYPSVPAGQARIRLSLTAAMSYEQTDMIYENILA